MALSSGGGHWTQLTRILPAIEGHDLTLVTVSREYGVHVAPRRVRVIRDVTRWNKVRWVQTVIQISWLLLRYRPHVVISTGALPGYFALRLAKMMGIRTIWLDSIANADELSMSGQKVGKYADLWLTQWPHLARPEGPHYAGAVL